MVLQRNEVEVRKAAQIIEDITSVLKEEEMNKEMKMNIKKQFCLLVSDPENLLEGKDLTGWVLQIPEDDSPSLLLDRLHKSAYDFNATPKGRRMPVQTIAEACEVVPPKISKEHLVWIKTKEPVLVVTTNNEIPVDAPSSPD